MIELHPTTTQNTSPNPQSELHWLSALAVVGGSLLVFIFLIGTSLFAVSGLLAIFQPESVATGQPGLLFSYAAAGLLLSLLTLPMVLLSASRLRKSQRTAGIFTSQLTRKHASLLGLVYILILMGGMLFSELLLLEWLVMPVLNVLAVGLPVILLFWLGTKNLPPSSSQRNWTTFGVSISLSPFLIVVIELLVIFTGMILLLIVLSFYLPDMPARIEGFVLMLETAQAAGEIPEEELISLLQSPLVVGGLLFFTAVLVPLVEESIKPLGVWLLSGRDLTPQDGWVLGLLSGGGFALVENLGNLAVGQGWAGLAVARGGAAALHMFNTAIIGYTFVLSRRRKQSRWVIMAFLGALLLHALWNSTAVMAMISTLDQIPADAGWPTGYLVILGLTTSGAIWGIHRVNQKLAAEARIESESENYVNDRPDLKPD